jgi:hypothetical protein
LQFTPIETEEGKRHGVQGRIATGDLLAVLRLSFYGGHTAVSGL